MEVPGGSAPEGFPRYQYAGGWGYETGGFDPGGGGRGPAFGDDAYLLSLAGVNPNLPPITLQHVGHRWYQPDIGRFVQRDPIGVEGGLNVYAYCRSRPLHLVDPAGLFSSLHHPEAAVLISELAALGYTMQRGAHGAARVAERFINMGRDPRLIVSCIQLGQKYWDPLNKAIVHVAGKVQVAVTPSGIIKTVQWVSSGRIAGRFQPLDAGYPAPPWIMKP